jgi:rhamnosyltransferase subunit B
MRLVITHWGSYGDVFPYLGLGLALRARGHSPVLATAPYYRAMIEGLGLEFSPVPPDIDPADTALVQRIMTSRLGPRHLIREVIVPAVRDSFAALERAVQGADLLVTHPITFAGPLVAERHRLPWVSTVLAPMSFFSPHDLPVFPDAPWLTRIAAPRPWLARAVIGLGRRVTRGWTAPVRALRAELGLRRRGDPLYEGQFSPYLTLAMYSPLLGAPQPDWPANTRVTGFISHNGPLRTPDTLAAFLDAGPPPVVFTLGSSAVGAAGAFYAESAKAVAKLGVRAVMLVGIDARNRGAAVAPERLLEIETAPHAALFPRAAAIVHHGGVGTTGQALRAGRPMLVVPHAFDQFDNAARVQRLGVALAIPARRYRADRVADALERLLGDPRYTRRSAEVGAALQAEDGAARACAAIEEIARGVSGAEAARG